ncbi:unnamed protein product [Urochloa decumbens]|uniref:non-specific serine/threonine protein kinase n=1 Tax=Urochloa decumbens TaxID=240449 RepID=A0ABC9AYZ7_9POAL
MHASRHVVHSPLRQLLASIIPRYCDIPVLQRPALSSCRESMAAIEQNPRITTAWSLMLLLSLASAGVLLQAFAQLDGNGFISIDCGLPGTVSYVDEETSLYYAPDAAFTDTGSNHDISDDYITPELSRIHRNVRSFPDGERNCYTLRSLMAGSKYLVRATFKYGDYDRLSRPPIFDLYVGVNFMSEVNISDPDAVVILEAVVVVVDDVVQVCLVNTGTGTPFISGLELRPLKDSLYPQANATQGLLLLGRRNFGPTNKSDMVRYPYDPYDRIWLPWINTTYWAEVSTTIEVMNFADDLFNTPSKVMQTAVTPRNNSTIEFFWDPKPQPKDPTPGYIAILHFAELQLLPANTLREFYINLNGKPWYPKPYSPTYLYTDTVYNTDTSRGGPAPAIGGFTRRYDISINATANSTLPPTINAIEVFSVVPTTNIGMDSQDTFSMTTIKAQYQVEKNWMGDPCVPKTLAWNGLTCVYAISGPPRIIGLNLSFSGLKGNISSSFAKLKAIQYLDLSHNSLTGSIPDSLSQLPSLTVLYLTGNQLSGSIPSGLLKRVQNGTLELRYGNDPNLCSNGSSSCQSARWKSKLAVYISVPILVVLVTVLVFAFCLLRRRNQGNELTGNGYGHSSLHLENRRFTYRELEMITDGFQRVLGRGGFGYVYSGFLEDGTQVAVKLRSHSSNQGVKEFLAETQILTRIHHKNLVSMVGYCKDGEHMALVYEYMAEGTLQEHIAGSDHDERCLTWRQRLRIALESAQGLEYLHKGCNPPLIHRDVKATNILLNEKLEAKLADFGLSRAFGHNSDTHISTNTLVGTPGYVDPEYQATMQPTIKSDVYSFGVVLLELITGKPAILRDPEPTSIIQWVRQRLARGDIEGVVDARLPSDDHNVNGVWKVADVALKCTAIASVQRPTMTDVVMQLQECLELEEGRASGNTTEGFVYTGSSVNLRLDYNHALLADLSAEVSQKNDGFPVDHNFGMLAAMMSTGPTTR